MRFSSVGRSAITYYHQWLRPMVAFLVFGGCALPRAAMWRVFCWALLLGSVDAYRRSADGCTATYLPANSAECQAAAAAVLPSYSWGGSAGSEWPQGCIVNGASVFYAAAMQTGANTLSPADSGFPFICRSAFTSGQASCALSAGAVATQAQCSEATLVLGLSFQGSPAAPGHARSTGQCASGRAVANSA